MPKDAKKLSTDAYKGVRDFFPAEMAVQKLGQKRDSVDKAIGNVELTWKIDDQFLKQAHYYGAQMLEMKQIRALPDYTKFINPTFVAAMMKAS